MSVVTTVIFWVGLAVFAFAVVSVWVKRKGPRGIRENPLPTYEDPDLGAMKWSNDDEAWVGASGGLQIALSYECRATPTPQLLSYAKEVLGDPTWLVRTLEEEMKSWAQKVPPNVKAELAALRFGLIHFSMHQDQGYIFANLEGGGGNRSWRIEYHGRTCDGLGFDT